MTPERRKQMLKEASFLIMGQFMVYRLKDVSYSDIEDLNANNSLFNQAKVEEKNEKIS